MFRFLHVSIFQFLNVPISEFPHFPTTLTVHFLLSRRSRGARRQMNFCISQFLDFSILFFLFRPSLHHERRILEQIPADMIKETARQAHRLLHQTAPDLE